MKDNELQFDRSCHVLYSRPCKKEIQKKIALHYPETERKAVWEQVQRQYVDFLSNWRTDLGGKKNFHKSRGLLALRLCVWLFYSLLHSNYLVSLKGFISPRETGIALLRYRCLNRTQAVNSYNTVTIAFCYSL